MGAKNSKEDSASPPPSSSAESESFWTKLTRSSKDSDSLAQKIYSWSPMHGVLWLDSKVVNTYSDLTKYEDILSGKVGFLDWPNELKLPIMVIGGLLVLAICYEFYPLLEVPVWIAEKFALLDWELLEWLTNEFVSLTSKLYVNPFLARLTILNLFFYLLLWAAQEVLNHFLAPLEKDDQFWYTFNFLEEYSSSLLLNFLDPPSIRGENSPYPFFGRIYDWLCSLLVLPISGLNFLLTPLVMLFYSASDEVTATVGSSGKIETVKRNVFKRPQDTSSSSSQQPN
jgi:hypothetical protein